MRNNKSKETTKSVLSVTKPEQTTLTPPQTKKLKLPKYKYYIAYNNDKHILSIGPTSKRSVLQGAKKFIQYRKDCFFSDWKTYDTNFKAMECTESLFNHVTASISNKKVQWFIYEDKAISIDDLKEISQEHNGKTLRLVKSK